MKVFDPGIVDDDGIAKKQQVEKYLDTSKLNSKARGQLSRGELHSLYINRGGLVAINKSGEVYPAT